MRRRLTFGERSDPFFEDEAWSLYTGGPSREARLFEGLVSTCFCSSPESSEAESSRALDFFARSIIANSCREIPSRAATLRRRRCLFEGLIVGVAGDPTIGRPRRCRREGSEMETELYLLLKSADSIDLSCERPFGSQKSDERPLAPAQSGLITKSQ